ncbi:MAG: hypothetical protein WCA90_05415, partial [Ilumatobacteraceae bacterium]
MERTTKTLIFDDGTTTARHALERARPVSAEVTLVCSHESANRTWFEEQLTPWGVPFQVHQLDAHQGIRHAISIGASASVTVIFVPDPGSHRGALVRKCVQGVGAASHFELPAAAIHIVRDAPVVEGPIAVVGTPDRRDGFADLLGAAFAASVQTSLQRVVVGPDVSPEIVEHQSQSLIDDASRLVTQGHVPTLPASRVAELDPSAVTSQIEGARAAVVGFGGFEVKGHKWTAPDEIPDSVLETDLGRLVHVLADSAPCDVVVVIDAVRLRHGAAAGVALGLVATAIIAGTAIGRGGVAAAAGPVGGAGAAVVADSATPAAQVSVRVVSKDTIMVSNPTTEALTVTVHLMGRHGHGGTTYDAGLREIAAIPAGAHDLLIRLPEFSHD